MHNNRNYNINLSYDEEKVWCEITDNDDFVLYFNTIERDGNVSVKQWKDFIFQIECNGEKIANSCVYEYKIFYQYKILLEGIILHDSGSFEKVEQDVFIKLWFFVDGMCEQFEDIAKLCRKRKN